MPEPSPATVHDADLENPAHSAAILKVLDSYASDPIGGGSPLEDDVRERLVPSLLHHPTTCILLAFADDEPIGLANCFFGFSTFRAKPLLNVHDLAVVPAWRGRGVGRALLAAAEERARARGCCKLTLEVQEDNARAWGLYRSFGFEDMVVTRLPTRFLTKPL